MRDHGGINQQEFNDRAVTSKRHPTCCSSWGFTRRDINGGHLRFFDPEKWIYIYIYVVGFTSNHDDFTGKHVDLFHGENYRMFMQV